MSSNAQEHEDRPWFLAHHFDTVGQQMSSAKLGMWLFACTEVLMFSGLFLAYFIFRQLYPEMVLRRVRGAQQDRRWPQHHRAVDLVVHDGARGPSRADEQQQGAQRNLLITIACAFIFMGVKYIEYSAKIEHGLLPGHWYRRRPARDHAAEVLARVLRHLLHDDGPARRPRVGRDRRDVLDLHPRAAW